MSGAKRQKKQEKRKRKLREEKAGSENRFKISEYISKIINRPRFRGVYLTRAAGEPPEVTLAVMRRMFHEESLDPASLGAAFPKSYANLKNDSITFINKPLSHELNWSTCLFVHFSSRLNELLGLKGEFDSRLISGDYAAAQETLDRITQGHGFSLWSIEAALLVAELGSGFQQNKETLASIKDALPEEGLASLYAEYLSQKIESAISSDNYNKIINNLVSLVEKHLERPREEMGRKLIANLRLRLNFFDLQEFDTDLLSHFLYDAGEYSLIDRYLAYVKVICLMASNDRLSPMTADVAKSIHLAAQHIRDSRLGILDQIYSNTGTVDKDTDRDRLIEAADAYTAGDYARSASLAESGMVARPDCFDYYELLINSSIHAGREPGRGPSGALAAIILESVHEVAAKGERTRLALDAVKKLAYMLDSSRMGIQLYAFWVENGDPNPRLNFRLLSAINALSISGRITTAMTPASGTSLLQRLGRRHPRCLSVSLFAKLNRLALTTALSATSCTKVTARRPGCDRFSVRHSPGERNPGSRCRPA